MEPIESNLVIKSEEVLTHLAVQLDEPNPEPFLKDSIYTLIELHSKLNQGFECKKKSIWPITFKERLIVKSLQKIITTYLRTDYLNKHDINHIKRIINRTLPKNN